MRGSEVVSAVLVSFLPAPLTVSAPLCVSLSRCMLLDDAIFVQADLVSLARLLQRIPL